MTATITALVARVAMDTSQVSAGAAQVRKDAAVVSRMFREMETDTDKLERKVRSLHAQYQRGAITNDQYRLALQHLESQQRRLADQTKQTATVTSNSNSSLISSIKAVAAAYVSFQGAKAGLAIASDVEQATIAFETMAGSAEKGQKMYADLRKFAASTPITLNGAQQAAKTLLAFGVDSQKIIPTLKMLGDVSGGNQERFNQLSLAFAQTQAAGRLMGQEVLQFINAGFNPLQIISEKTGRSMADLKKDMENGAISANMVTAAFMSATSEGGRFFGMMDRMSKTALGSYNQLLSAVQELVASAGQVFLPMLARVAQMMEKGIRSVQSFAGSLNKTQVQMLTAVAAFSAAIIIIPKLVSAIGSIVTAIRAMTAAQVTALAFTGPKGWAQIAASAAIAAAAVYGVSQAFDEYQQSLQTAADKGQEIADSQKQGAEAAGEQGRRLTKIEKSFFAMENSLKNQIQQLALGEDAYRRHQMILQGYTLTQVQRIDLLHQELKLVEAQQKARERQMAKMKEDAANRKRLLEDAIKKGQDLMERNNPVLAVSKQLAELQMLLRVNAIDQKTFFRERNKILKESLARGAMPEASAIEVGSAEFVRMVAGQMNEEKDAQIQKMEEQRLLQAAQLAATKETNRRLQEMGIVKRI